MYVHVFVCMYVRMYQLDKSMSFDDIAGIDEAKNRVCMCMCMSLCAGIYVCM